MANEQNGNKITIRRTMTWFGGMSALFMMGACLQIAGIDQPIFDPNVNGGGGSGGGGTASTSSSASGMGGSGSCTPNEFKSCFVDENAPTNGVGECKAGTKVCFDGKFLPCGGETFPKTEDCSTNEDEDCNGHSSIDDDKCLTVANWGEEYGTPAPWDTSDDALYAAVPHPDGGYVFGGLIGGKVGVDGFAVMTGKGYVTKYAATGEQAWHYEVLPELPSSYAVVRGVVVDGQGATFVVGSYNGNVTIGGTSYTSISHDGFILKLSPMGDLVWKKPISANNSQIFSAVAVDSMGNIYVTGWINGAVDFGGGMSATPNLADAFIASYDSTGMYRWHRVFVNPNTQNVKSIAVIPGPPIHVVIGGNTDGAIDMGGGILPYAAAQDIFLASYAGSDGIHKWSKAYGDVEDQFVHAISVDAKESILVTGQFSGTIDWGNMNTMEYVEGPPGVYLARLSKAGDYEMGISAGVAGKSYGFGVQPDSRGNIVVVGHLDGTVDWGGMEIVSGAGTATDAFAVILDGQNLKPKLGTLIGKMGDQRIWAVAAQSDDHVVVAGSFTGMLTVPGRQNATTMGGADIFAARLPVVAP